MYMWGGDCAVRLYMRVKDNYFLLTAYILYDILTLVVDFVDFGRPKICAHTAQTGAVYGARCK